MSTKNKDIGKEQMAKISLEKDYWNDGIKNFKLFVDEHKHPFVPYRNNDKSPFTYGVASNGEDFKLGRWVVYARDEVFKKARAKSLHERLKDKRYQALRNLGFIPNTDIKKMLSGDIYSSAEDIDEFMNQVVRVIANNGKSLNQLFFEKLQERAEEAFGDYDMFVDLYGQENPERSRIHKLLNDMHELIVKSEKFHKKILSLRNQIPVLIDEELNRHNDGIKENK